MRRALPRPDRREREGPAACLLSHLRVEHLLRGALEPQRLDREHELVEIYGRSTVMKPLMPERIAVQQAEGYGQPVQLVKTAGGREVADIYETYLTKLLKAAR